MLSQEVLGSAEKHKDKFESMKKSHSKVNFLRQSIRDNQNKWVNEKSVEKILLTNYTPKTFKPVNSGDI